TVALRHKPAIHWQSLMIVLCGSAFVVSLPFLLWEGLSGSMILPDARGWTIAVYTAIFPSVLSQVFFIRGVELIGANRAGLLINMVPIFGTLLSIIILGEAFHLYHAAAMALVLGGVWLAGDAGRTRGRGCGRRWRGLAGVRRPPRSAPMLATGGRLRAGCWCVASPTPRGRACASGRRGTASPWRRRRASSCRQPC